MHYVTHVLVCAQARGYMGDIHMCRHGHMVLRSQIQTKWKQIIGEKKHSSVAQKGCVLRQRSNQY